jgi:alpha-N-arabinofuranosidase
VSTRESSAGTSTIAAVIDASQVGEPITPYIYGQFIEHLGDLINHGLWAEMLDDRKFYFPVQAQEEATPSPPWRRKARRWKPVGPQESVRMDRHNPYVGDHTPLVLLDGAAPHGIQQAGLALRRGQAYAGRVILAGDPAADVHISLVWGPGEHDRETIAIPGLLQGYAKFPLRFTAAADTDDGRLEIVGTGVGTLHIGAISLMPANHIRGFRPDTIALLKQLRSAIYRFPGGNFVSNHDWRDAIGDPDRRPPRWDHAWSVAQPNDVGTDEFIVLCELLDVEPYITVNAGYGDARSAADLVEYANGAPDTPMGGLRATNGRPEPYHIRWWGIGNEMYGWWQFGHMSLNHFVIKHNLFAEAMRRVDPTIKLIAGGAMPDHMTVSMGARRITGRVLTEYGSDADWTGGLLTHCLEHMDVLSEHWYAYDGKRFDIEVARTAPQGDTSAGNVPVQEPLVEWARRPANYVRCKVEAYEDYLQRIPGLAAKKVPVNIDEWAYAGARPSLKVAISHAWVLHEMFRHTDIIKMAAYTFATSCIDWDGASAALNTTGLLFKLYRDHFGSLPLAISGNSPQPPPRFPVGGDQPRINAGSATYPLDVAAALTEDRRALTVAIVNPTESAQELTLTFQGIDPLGQGTLWRMTGPTPDAANMLHQEPQVRIEEVPVQGMPVENRLPLRLTVAPVSVTLCAFPIS